MALVALLLSIACQAPPAPENCSDLALLKDGRSVMGQVLSLDRNGAGGVEILVRRDWARQHFPDRVDDWERSDRSRAEPARLERLERLREWRRERASEPGDSLSNRIDAEIARLEKPDLVLPLLQVRLEARDVTSLTRRPPELARRLRQGWLAGFDGVEEMAPDRLAAGLADRNFSPENPAPVDRLLPPPRESVRHWTARRAATEVLDEPALRYIRQGSLVLSESADVQNPAMLLAPMLDSTLKELLGDASGLATNPLEPIGRQVAARGRVGLVVTETQMSDNLDQVKVTCTLYMRLGPTEWQPAGRRDAVVSTAEAGQTDAIANDPRVQSIFSLLDAVAPGGAGQQAKALSLQVGSTTQVAVGRARQALDHDLEAVSLSLGQTP